MQSVMHPFRDITALNIINIVDQLLRATRSGTVCMHHIWFALCIPSSSEASRRYFSEERTTETVDILLRDHQLLSVTVLVFVIRVNCSQRARVLVLSQCHNDR